MASSCPRAIANGESAQNPASIDNIRIRKIGTDGIVSTVAGTGEQGVPQDGEITVNAKLGNIQGLAVMADGSLLFSDSIANRIFKISQSGIISTFAVEMNDQIRQ